MGWAISISTRLGCDVRGCASSEPGGQKLVIVRHKLTSVEFLNPLADDELHTVIVLLITASVLLHTL